MNEHKKHKVFISFHSNNDQGYKDALINLNNAHDLFIDASVDTGNISDSLTDDVVRQKIRDEYLRDSTVTILLVGIETRNRKHVDWEIYSSMYDGKINKKSGVLVINLPSTGCTYYTAAHGDKEKSTVYPSNSSWMNISKRSMYDERYPYMPARVIDNLLASNAKVSVTNWDVIINDVEKLRFLIDATYADRAQCEYDLSRPMRRANS